MEGPPRATSSQTNDSPSEDRLNSWKDIAAYLQRGVTTVQRWEREEGLPVHRPVHARGGSVFAFKPELDSWWKAHSQKDSPDSEAASESFPNVDASGQIRIRWHERSPRGLVLTAASLAACAVLVFGTIRVYRGEVSHPASQDSPGAPLVPTPLANDAESETSPTLIPRRGAGGVLTGIGKQPRVSTSSRSRGARRAGSNSIVASTPWAGLTRSWSPRGDLIAFLRGEGEHIRGLYVVSPSGGSPRRLTAISGIGLCWTPDGRSLAFADRTDGEPFSIFAISLDTGLRRRLTTPKSGTFGDTYCAFSPDGRELAIARHDTISQSDLYVATIQDGDSGSVSRLTENFSWNIGGVDWTPDGESIVFGSHNGLWVAPPHRTSATTPKW